MYTTTWGDNSLNTTGLSPKVIAKDVLTSLRTLVGSCFPLTSWVAFSQSSFVISIARSVEWQQSWRLLHSITVAMKWAHTFILKNVNNIIERWENRAICNSTFNVILFINSINVWQKSRKITPKYCLDSFPLWRNYWWSADEYLFPISLSLPEKMSLLANGLIYFKQWKCCELSPPAAKRMSWPCPALGRKGA